MEDRFQVGEIDTRAPQQFIERFNSKVECIMEDYTTWDEQIQILREECGLELSIRKNDKDVRC